jgi:plasmid replication initiation protein
MLDLLRYWQNFNEEKSNNAFAYFSQIVKNVYAKEYKKIHKHIGKGEKIEFVSLSFTGESEIFSI